VSIAHRRFLSDGYFATTIASVAAEAGVSTETVYKTFGGKPGLVRAVVTAALAGDGPVPAYQRSDTLQATETDPRKIVRGWGRFVAELAPRGAPVMLVMRDAAVTDKAVAELVETIDNERLARMTDNARRLAAAGHLRPDVDVIRAAELMWTYTSASLYELLVIKRRWSPQQYGDFVADALTAALLEA
jgi:AcrR family transcriptional regulator